MRELKYAPLLLIPIFAIQLLQKFLFCSFQSNCEVYPALFGQPPSYILITFFALIILVAVSPYFSKIEFAIKKQTKHLAFGIAYVLCCVIFLLSYIKITPDTVELRYFPILFKTLSFSEIQSFSVTHNWSGKGGCSEEYAIVSKDQQKYDINTITYLFLNNSVYKSLLTKIHDPEIIESRCGRDPLIFGED